MASLPVGVLQSHLPPPQIRNKVKKQIWGLYSTNRGADSTPDRAVTTREQWETPLNIQGRLGFNNSNHTPYQGDKDTSLHTNLTLQGTDTRRKKLGFCSFNNTEHKHRKLHKMVTQRNMLWRKEQDKSLQEPINEEKILVSIMINFPIQFSLVTQSCPTLCDPVDCSMPGFPVHHQLPNLAQTQVH